MNKMNIATVGIAILIVMGIIWIIFFDDVKIKNESNIPEDSKVLQYDEIKAVWISYLDLSPMLKGKTEKEFKSNISKALDNVEALGLNTVIVQVRPFSDAIYKSKYFPWSSYCTGTEGGNPGYDPLKIMIEEAHSRKIRLEAWINPYRVRNDSTKTAIDSSNPASEWINSGSDSIININGGIYYNPGSESVRELVVNGVKEIVENYRVDGIHFDDYFYPSSDINIDKKVFDEYVASGGNLDLANWRRENVNIVVKQVYKAIKEINSEVVFGISPQGSMKNNFENQYIDVKKMVQNPGYIDYICPQVYYGFENQGNDFTKAINEFNDMVTEPSVKLYLGLSPYKLGSEDTWAGNGKDEWKNTTDILKRQVAASEKLKNYDGVFFFRYDSLFNPGAEVKNQVEQEVNNLKEVFKHTP
ncbi:MAG: family 10 glycosylhydrolase [Clostridium sp.]|uniref:glycoside hydrolase family 10 protein n=1 Tax=Clostridium sp. TaxID=1506 RepID=UPI00305F8B70